GGRDGLADQFGAGILLAVARRLRATESRERMHAVDHAGLFKPIPYRLVFRLQWVVAHRVHRSDKRDAAAERRHPADLLDRIVGVLRWNEGGEKEPLGIFARVMVRP